MEQKSTLWRNVSYILWAAISIVCAFFIVYHSEWLFGDDAIVMKYTGWGRFFPMSHTVSPEIGRFFPFSYLMYNILPIFFHGQISATIVYVYQALWFIAFSWMSFYLVQDMLRNQPSVWRYTTALMVAIFLVGRHYSDFINCYSTSWFGAVLNGATILFAYLFYDRKKPVYGILAFAVLFWITYCSEVSFVVPLAWGVCALPLWKKSTKAERIFHIALIVNAVVFLLIYFFAIYLKTVSAYDGAHGAETTFLTNAIHILVAQKFLWVVILLFCVRIWDIIRNKSEYTIFDVLILVAAAHCFGGFILKLNWVLYYNRAVVIALPAVIYFGDKYLRPYLLCILMALFAGWYGIKIPKAIKKQQGDRAGAIEFMNAISSKQKETGLPIYLFAIDITNPSFEGEMVRWLYSSFETYYDYETQDINAELPRVAEYQGKGIYITIKYNDQIVPNSNEIVSQYCDTISYNEMRDMNAWISK